MLWRGSQPAVTKLTRQGARRFVNVSPTDTNLDETQARPVHHLAVVLNVAHALHGLPLPHRVLHSWLPGMSSAQTVAK